MTYADDDDDDKLSMTLHGKTNHKYLAVGFSSDASMGEDFVLACLPDDKTVVPRWNIVGGKTNQNKIDNGTFRRVKCGYKYFIFYFWVRCRHHRYKCCF